MAVRTVQARMSSNEWETVVVLLHRLEDDAPSLHGVTLLAVRTHLPAMNIGMAIGAMHASVREHRLRVTLCTTHAHVKAAQRIFRLVVIEFRNGADRLPANRGVAVLARDRQIAVRTAGHSLVRLPSRRQGRHRAEKCAQHKDGESNARFCFFKPQGSPTTFPKEKHLGCQEKRLILGVSYE